MMQMCLQEYIMATALPSRKGWALNQGRRPPISDVDHDYLFYLHSFLACPGSMLDDRERLFWPSTLDMFLGSTFCAKCCMMLVYSSKDLQNVIISMWYMNLN